MNIIEILDTSLSHVYRSEKSFQEYAIIIGHRRKETKKSQINKENMSMDQYYTPWIMALLN